MTHRYDHVLAWTLDHPWALSRPMLSVVATILARHVSDTAPRAADAEFVSRPPSQPAKSNGVMVIPIHGVIAPRITLMSDISGGATFEDATKALAEGMAAPNVSTIILDWDSPGGSVAGAHEFAAAVLDARKRKRIISHANYEMCSAAYWCGACASEIVASASSVVGSVGVYCIHEDLSRALDELGVKVTFISAGKYKVDGNETEPLSDTARARLQKMVDTYYGSFVTDVAAGRGIGVDAVRAGFGEGSVVTAADALTLGMVDRIETFDQTLDRALSLPPLPQVAARVATHQQFERLLHGLTF